MKFMYGILILLSISGQNDINIFNNARYDSTMDSFLAGVKTSSYLKTKVKDQYAGWKAIDGDVNTCWVEGKKDEGIGEWIEFYATDRNSRKPKVIIEIYSGVGRNETLFYQNNRPRAIEVVTYNRVTNLVVMTHAFELEDKMGYQRFFLNGRKEFFEKEYVSKNLNAPDVAIKILIKSVYKGSKYNDTAISEIRLIDEQGMDVFDNWRKN